MVSRFSSFWRLALFSLLTLVPLPSIAQSLTDSCPPEGCAALECGKELNRNKNRTTAPSSQEIDPTITLQAILEPGDDETRWRTTQAASIEGYVVGVDHGGCAESCNCNKGAVRDTHIDIALSLSDQATLKKHVVVEVTPRMREIMRQQGVDWSTETLHDQQRGIIGKKVRFTGWMLFDSMHERESFNTRKRARNLCGTLQGQVWRATAWEIHPVTSMEVIETPTLPPSFVFKGLNPSPCFDKPCSGGGHRPRHRRRRRTHRHR